METLEQSALNVSLVLFMAIAVPIALVVVALSMARSFLMDSFSASAGRPTRSV